MTKYRGEVGVVLHVRLVLLRRQSDGLVDPPRVDTSHDVGKGVELRGVHSIEDGGQVEVDGLVIAFAVQEAGDEELQVQLGQGHIIPEAMQKDRVDHPRTTDGHLGDEFHVGLDLSEEECAQVRVADARHPPPLQGALDRGEIGGGVAPLSFPDIRA